MAKTLQKVSKNVNTNVKIPHQTYASSVASLTILIAAFWSIYISPVLLKFKSNEVSYQMSKQEAAWAVSIMDLANFLSPIPAGILMHKIGRKTTLMLSSAVYLVAALFAIFSTSAIYLIVARFLAGIGKGFSFTVSPIYVAEISSKSIRGALSSTFYAFFCCGMIIATDVGPFVSFDTFNYISLTLPLIFLILMAPLPESPYYYFMKNKEAAAETSLRWFRNISTNRLKFLTDVEQNEIKQAIEEGSKRKGTFRDLLGNHIYRHALMLVTMVGLAQRFGGISYFLSYGAADLPDSGHAFSRAQCMAFFGIGSLISNIVSGFLLDSVGRKPILLFSTISTSVCMFVGAGYFVARPGAEDPEYYYIPYSLVIIFSLVFTAGLGVIPATFQGELFPAEIKQHASAIVVMALSLGSFSVNYTHDLVTDFVGVAGNYFIAAGCSLFFSIFACLYVFETKGKTLIEIQETLSRSASKASLFSVQSQCNLKSRLTEDRLSVTNVSSETDLHSKTDIHCWQNFGKKQNGSANGSNNKKSVNRTSSEILMNSSNENSKFYLNTFKSMSINELKVVNEGS